jgi:NAD(P)-dependent dehydrogenase (short-subunit alcohol dehydrogenase family)
MTQKEILIAGGTSGIGLSTVKLLAREGWSLTCACRNPANLPDLDQVRGVPHDATTSPDTLELPERLDGFVYFPGTITLKPFQRLTEEDFLADLQVNLLGAVRLIQRALPALRKGTQPSIVLFSTVAVQTGLSFHASIAAAKGAVEGLVRSLAAEFAPTIRVNCIAPSLTDTPLAAFLLGNEDKRQASANRHPLKQIGDPADVAEMVKFLLGDHSSFMSGQVVNLDGGLSNLRPI